MPETLQADLRHLAERGRLRTLRQSAGIDFTSNDYLGLAASAELRDAAAAAIARGVPVGSGGSRLLRGNHPEHEALEAEAAATFGAETALYFGAGYSANLAIFSTLPQSGDLVIYDQLVHASVHDGLRRCRADRIGVRHNDVGAINDAIAAWRAKGGIGRPWIATETIFSMDGDRPDLAQLMEVADQHDAIVVLDEAHATGAVGDNGRGLGALYEGRDNVITLHTCGKALGTSGGFVLGSRTIRDFLINRARPFIFATAPSPLIAAVTRAALDLVRTDPARRARLAQLVDFAAKELRRCSGIASSGSHIQPIIVGADTAAVELAEHLQSCGFDVRAIRPPTVPEGTARLRIALTCNVDEAAITQLFEVLATKLKVAA
jgi:8-amino-7-oxononanoate synthase